MKIQLLNPDASLPSRGSEKAAGMDLHSAEDCIIEPTERRLVSTGIAVAVPHSTYGRVAPRSGLAVKHGIDVLAGVVDEDYRGEVKVALINHGTEPFVVNKGDRIAQLIIESISRPVIEVVASLEDTTRGSGGFGSTGK